MTLLDVAQQKIDEGLSQMANSGNSPQSPTQDPAQLFNSRLKTLIGRIKEAGPDGNEAKTLVAAAGTTAKQGNWQQALLQLDAAEQSLAKIGDQPTSGNQSLNATDLTNATKELRTQIDQLLTLVPGKKPELYGLLSGLANQIKAGSLELANQSLVNLKGQTENLTQEASLLDQRMKEIEPKLQDGKLFKPEEFNNITAAFSIATESFAAGDFKRVNQILEKLAPRVEELLQQAPQKDTDRLDIREGIVAEQRERLEAFFRQRYEIERLDTQGELKQLEGAVEMMAADPIQKNWPKQYCWKWKMSTNNLSPRYSKFLHLATRKPSTTLSRLNGRSSETMNW